MDEAPWLGDANDPEWDDRWEVRQMDYCPRCAPLGCDCSDLDRPEAVSPDLLPSWAAGCHCGAAYDGRDCMCHEADY